MKLKLRFSIGYFSLEVIFISLGLGFLTVLIHAPNTQARSASEGPGG